MLLFYFDLALASLDITLVKFLFVILPGSWEEVVDLSLVVFGLWLLASLVTVRQRVHGSERLLSTLGQMSMQLALMIS